MSSIHDAPRPLQRPCHKFLDDIDVGVVAGGIGLTESQ